MQLDVTAIELSIKFYGFETGLAFHYRNSVAKYLLEGKLLELRDKYLLVKHAFVKQEFDLRQQNLGSRVDQLSFVL